MTKRLSTIGQLSACVHAGSNSGWIDRDTAEDALIAMNNFTALNNTYQFAAKELGISKALNRELVAVLKEISEFWAYGLSAKHKPTAGDLKKAEELGEKVAAVLDKAKRAEGGDGRYHKGE